MMRLAIALSGPVIANIIVYRIMMQTRGCAACSGRYSLLGDPVLAVPQIV
jgi:hypothetical protein